MEGLGPDFQLGGKRRCRGPSRDDGQRGPLAVVRPARCRSLEVPGTGKEILLFLFTVGFGFHLFMSLKCDLLFWVHFPAIQAWRGLFLL